ncbi:MAG TPA: hypothetical protein VGE23_00215 [Candidatus Paceibacterota bacterium]
MGASVSELAQATQRMKERSDRSVGWPLAAIKAIEGKGIRHKPDVDRLKKSVLAHLRETGVIPPLARGAQKKLYSLRKV